MLALLAISQNARQSFSQMNCDSIKNVEWSGKTSGNTVGQRISQFTKILELLKNLFIATTCLYALGYHLCLAKWSVEEPRMQR